MTQRPSPPPNPSTTTQPTLAAAESIIYSVDVEEVKVGGNKYLLVFTDRRIVSAFEGGGLTRLATTGIGRMAYDDAKIKWMKGRTIEELLSDDRSFFIPYSELRVIEFVAIVQKVLFTKMGYISVKINKAADSLQDLMIARTMPEKLDEIERYLKPVLGEKIVLRK